MRLALYLVVMAGVTYLIRMLPFTLFTKKIESTFIKSFLYYVPYAVLSAMTFPAILYSTGSMISAIVGCVVALILAFRNCSLTDLSGSSVRKKGAVAEVKVCNSSFFCANFCKKYRTRKNIDKNPEDGLSNKQKKREFQKIQNLVKKQGIKDGKPISRCCT